MVEVVELSSFEVWIKSSWVKSSCVQLLDELVELVLINNVNCDRCVYFLVNVIGKKKKYELTMRLTLLAGFA